MHNGFQRVAVIGAGQMGAGIAQVCLQAGCQVHLVDASDSALAAGRQRIEQGLRKLAEKGQLLADPADLLANLETGASLELLSDRELVLEAVSERLELKREVLAAAANHAPADCIIATNTSSLSIAELATSVDRPERFLGLHFFNPVPRMPLVELVPHPATDPAVAESAREFAADQLQKQVVVCSDQPGFVVNALLIPYICSAIRLLEQGRAAAADIDLAMTAGAAHPIGPLALADLIGLDTLLAIAEVLAAAGQADPAPAKLRQLVAAGELGRKTGRGFFRYQD